MWGRVASLLLVKGWVIEFSPGSRFMSFHQDVKQCAIGTYRSVVSDISAV
jgi:hypothetical protein